MDRKLHSAVCLLVAGSLITVAGCKISKQDEGGEKHVSINVPGASVNVDTNGSVNDTGMPLYPGAQEKHGKSEENSHAHVNLDLPFLKLKVVELHYTSADSPEKVLAFYRQKLAVYGEVKECRGDEDVQVGFNSGDGKTRNWDSPVDCGATEKGIAGTGVVALKVGTQGNAHVVSVRADGSGSDFKLVSVHGGGKKEDLAKSDKSPS